MEEDLGSFFEELRGLAVRSRSVQLRDSLDRLDRGGHPAAGEVQRLMGRLVELGPALGELAAAASGGGSAPGAGAAPGDAVGLPQASPIGTPATAPTGRQPPRPPTGETSARHGLWRHLHIGGGRNG